MLSNIESGYPDQNNSSDGEFLRDIEEISKALYLENKTHENSVVSYSSFGPKSVKESNFTDLKLNPKAGFDKGGNWLNEDKKDSSIWGWKPFKALSHIRQRKFTCYFLCHVHFIENLMPEFDDVCMSVHWKRKDTVLRTTPTRVSNGVVEFEETLMSKCTVYGAKNGSGDFVKYEPKHFLLYASVVGGEGIEIGKHWVDLTRLLPLTLDELEQDRCSGKWSTSFKLVGKAKGATLHVSFGFLVTKDGLAESASCLKPPLALNLEQNGLISRMSFTDSSSVRGNTTLRRVGSVPSSLTNASYYSSQYLDAKLSLPTDVYDFSNSINRLYGKLEEGSFDSPARFDMVYEHLESPQLVPNSLSCSVKDFSGAKHDDAEFTVIDKGVESEFSCKEAKKLNKSVVEDLEVSSIEVIDIAELFKGEGICSDEERNIDSLDATSDCVGKDASIDKFSLLDIRESNFEEEALDLHKLVALQSDDQLEISDEMPVDIKVKHKGSNMVKSLSLDDFAKAVADDFYNLLQDTHTPSARNSNVDLESPRERLLRQFEEDMMTSGSLLLDVDVQEDIFEYDYAAPSISSSDSNGLSVDLSPVIDIAGFASDGSVQQSARSKLKAKSLERLETQTLMQRWGLNEEAFLNSPYYSSGGFGSPIFIASDEAVGLPPLAEGLEPLLQLKGGDFLRSMSPLLFRNARNCGSLIMQTSKTLVLPTELGSDIMEILQSLASFGGQRLSKKLHSLMPLEDLSGKIMQQLAREALYEAEMLKRPASSQHKSDIEVEEHSYVEGYNYLDSSSTGSDIGSEYVAVNDLAILALNSIEGLMIEGLKIQSGMPDHTAPSSIRVKSVKEVRSQHEIDYLDDSSTLLGIKGTSDYVNGLLDLSLSLDEWLRLDNGISDDEKQVSKRTLKLLRAHHAKSSYMGNESVGEENKTNKSRKSGVLGDKLTLAFMIQLRDPLRDYEPVGGPMLGLIQVKRQIKPVTRASEDKTESEERISRFTLLEAHVAGLNTESDDVEIWSSRKQQQSGSRWLLASGLTKNGNPRSSKSRSLMKMPTQMLRKAWSRSFIWSIFHTIHEVEADPQNPLTRNPDVLFPQVTS